MHDRVHVGSKTWSDLGVRRSRMELRYEAESAFEAFLDAPAAPERDEDRARKLEERERSAAEAKAEIAKLFGPPPGN